YRTRAGRAHNPGRILMRLPSVFLYGGLFAVLAFLTIACNTILGVEDVVLDCHVNSYFPLVTSSTVKTSLDHVSLGEEKILRLTFSLNVDANPDNLVIDMYESFLNGTGVYQIKETDDCRICGRIEADVDPVIKIPSQIFEPIRDNSLRLTVDVVKAQA